MAGFAVASPTVKMASACLMHRWVHTVSVESHWYSVRLCWSST